MALDSFKYPDKGLISRGMASAITNIQRFFGKKTPEELVCTWFAVRGCVGGMLTLGPFEKVKKWRQEIRSQQRAIQRQIQAIDVEEAKVKKSIKQVAKKGDTKICKMLAKELIRSQRHKNRLYTSKAQLESIRMQLEHQLGISIRTFVEKWKHVRC